MKIMVVVMMNKCSPVESSCIEWTLVDVAANLIDQHKRLSGEKSGPLLRLPANP